MNNLTIVLEVVLGFVGLTIAVGAPPSGMYLHRREDEPRAGTPLVGLSRDVALVLARVDVDLVAA